MSYPVAPRPWLVAALTAAASFCMVACQGQEVPGCRVARDVTLPAGPLDTAPVVRMDAVAAVPFFLGSDPASGKMSWTGIDAAGAPVGAGEAMVDAPAAGPWLAMGAVGATPAVAVVWGKVDPKSGLVDLMAETLAPGGSVLTAAARIVAGQGPAGEVDVALTGAGGASWVAFTHGTRDGSGVSVDELVLATLGLQVGISETSPAPDFRCPAGFHQTGTTGGFLMNRPDDKDPTLRVVELGDAGSITQNVYLGIDIDAPRCFFGARTAGGFGFAIQAAIGTYLVTYDTMTQNLIRTGVVGALRWGGESKQPPVAGLGYTGDGWALAFARATGPEVRRLAPIGQVDKGPLALPVATTAGGPVATVWATDPGLLWVTYLDGGRRRALAVDCKVQ